MQALEMRADVNADASDGGRAGPSTPLGTGRFGLRLALWYAAVFVASSLAIVFLTYTLLANSLVERDHQIVVSTLREYSERYETGGLGAVARAVEIEQRSGRHERLFVRVVRNGAETVFASMPPEWSDFDVSRLFGRSGFWEQAPSGSRDARLEVATGRLFDGTLLQVGKSTENREELLDRFRTVLALVSVAIVLIGLAGGIVVTRSTLQPINGLIRAVRHIIRTGNTETRVPVQADRDAIDELSALFNAMLDRITTLIAGMGNALDNVAHDLRTPMTRLRGLAERALQSGDPAAQREALATCLEESDRILSMLDTLMDISEAETGTMRLTRTATPLDALIAEVASVYEDVADEKQVTITTDVAAGLTVSADRDRLRQVVANLLDNAVKYTPAGGRIRVSALRGENNVRIEVSDTGAGILPHDLPRIWERLYRGDQSRAERGLGLGLSLVRAIVTAHGGTVDVQTEPGSGSRFVVTLPEPPESPRLRGSAVAPAACTFHACNVPVTAPQAPASSNLMSRFSRRRSRHEYSFAPSTVDQGRDGRRGRCARRPCRIQRWTDTGRPRDRRGRANLDFRPGRRAGGHDVVRRRRRCRRAGGSHRSRRQARLDGADAGARRPAAPRVLRAAFPGAAATAAQPAHGGPRLGRHRHGRRLHPHQQPRGRRRRYSARRADRPPLVRRQGRRHRPGDRPRGAEDRRHQPAHAAVRRLVEGQGRRRRARDRQPARRRSDGDDGHRQRQGALDEQRGLRGLHPDRRAHQPGQLRRRVDQRDRRAGGHQLADPHAIGRQHRAWLRHSVEHGAAGDGPAADRRQGRARPARRERSRT